jgi:hypothetical protein
VYLGREERESPAAHILVKTCLTLDHSASMQPSLFD